MIRLQATLCESSAGILNVPSLQCNGAFNPKYLSLGWVGTTGHLPGEMGSWLANQGISILAQVVFPRVMRMNWDGEDSDGSGEAVRTSLGAPGAREVLHRPQ